MDDLGSERAAFAERRPGFPATRWSVVLNARAREALESTGALSALCQIYWHPIYASVRRQGHSSHDAEDLTQEFFSRFLTTNPLKDVDPRKGRFRSFLLAALRNFLANQWDRQKAVKRGGRALIVRWDLLDEEPLAPLKMGSIERFFDRQWALTLLARVFDRLREECAAAGKGALFDALRPYVSGERSTSYAQIGERMSMTAGAVQVSVHRLRRRYGELLREEISLTVKSPEEIDSEIRELLAALRE